MNQFYVCIIFTGIMLILISLGLIAFDRKKGYDYSTKLNDKKEELEIIITDADQMINEMNKFSDYIVTQMELKNEEMTTNLKVIEEKYNRLSSKVSETIVENDVINDLVVNGNIMESLSDRENYQSKNFLVKKHDDLHLSNSNSTYFQTNKMQHKSKEKVIPINNKLKRVLQLSQNGHSDTEIAKSLNMGKGEVQLILEMNNKS